MSKKVGATVVPKPKPCVKCGNEKFDYRGCEDNKGRKIYIWRCLKCGELTHTERPKKSNKSA